MPKSSELLVQTDFIWRMYAKAANIIFLKIDIYNFFHIICSIFARYIVKCGYRKEIPKKGE